MKHCRWLVRNALFCLVATLVAGSGLAQQGARLRPAVRVDPIEAILDAFGTHNVVALGEPHGNEQAHAFRVSLIRDPRFAATVNDIVVECGNARYQDVMDRFVRGEDIPDASLRPVWQNTTVANFVWDRPIYEEFFRTVRAVNASRPKTSQIRVLLGDPPIDWSNVHSVEDHLHWLRERDSYPANIIRQEVFAKQRRALVVYGDGHLWRNDAGENLVRLLESVGGTKVFTISTPTAADLVTVQADIASWSKPSIALLRETVLGATEFAPLFQLPSGRFHSRRMEEQVDALLYLGPPSAMTVSRLSPNLCSDAAYVEMRLRRMAIDPGPPGSPAPIDRLKQNCAAVVGR
jgi:hypothetical protein